MARPKKSAKTSPVRLTEEAHRLAVIASGYTGESLAEYASRVLAEAAARDIERLHAEFAAGTKRQPRKPKGGE